jgi:hypothetical protein
MTFHEFGVYLATLEGALGIFTVAGALFFHSMRFHDDLVDFRHLRQEGFVFDRIQESSVTDAHMK